MAYRCKNCNKGVMYGHNVSHAKNRTRKVFKPNLHYTDVILDGTTRRVRLCTKCLRMYKRTQLSRIASQSPEVVTATNAAL
jgi:large subunit ribosomal protein L28